MRNLTSRGISPFPKEAYEDFSLAKEWYLPQHLPFLRVFLNKPNLEWDLSAAPEELSNTYRRIYKNSWSGDLGMLFYQRPNGLWAKLLPERWFLDKLNDKIPIQEFDKWTEVMKDLWIFQFKEFEREGKK